MQLGSDMSFKELFIRCEFTFGKIKGNKEFVLKADDRSINLTFSFNASSAIVRVSSDEIAIKRISRSEKISGSSLEKILVSFGKSFNSSFPHIPLWPINPTFFISRSITVEF